MEDDEDSYDTIYRIDGFENYEPKTEETPAALVAFFAIYVCLSIVLAIPITAWRQKNKAKGPLESGDDQVLNGEQEMVEVQQDNQQGPLHQQNHQLHHQKHHHHHDHHQQPGPTVPAMGVASEQPHGPERRRPSMDPPGLKERSGFGEAAEPATPLHHSAPPLTTPPILVPALDNGLTPAGQQDGLSTVPSAASTSRLQTSAAIVRRDTPVIKPLRSWDLASRPWGRSRPLGRADLISRSIALERQSQISEENASHGSRRSKTSWMSGPGRGPRPHRTMSDAASHILDEGEVEGEAEYYRQKYVQRSRSRRRQLSISTAGSLMPPLSPDVLAPEDAADAHDAGRVNRLEDFQQPDFFQSNRWGLCSPCCRGLGRLLELAESDYESRRILGQAVPSTIDAMADPLYRLVLLAIISHYIGTDSTAAFVLSILFIRLTTEEISGAITDVETNLVKEALSNGGEQCFANAGRCVQLAIIMQILLGVPILIIWAFLMDELVLWLVSDAQIANLAASYSKVIIVDYLFRGITRAFMLPFHLSGRIQFERNIDVTATILTLTAVAVAASNTDDPDGPALKDIGWIQVIIGVAKTFTKIFYLWMKGLLQPYFSGFKMTVDPSGIVSFLLQVIPLFLGSVLEIGEWEILLLFTRHLGAAEVTAWAVVGVIWEVCLASTEGLGEAASVRVSYYLAEGFPEEAKLMASKVACIACVEALIVSSILLVAGPNIVVAITTDTILEIIENQLIGLTALANLSTTFAQIYWSLAGAQGSYGPASATILLSRWLLTLPIAAICVFPYNFGLDSLAGCVSVGYATAAFFLSLRVFNSDWKALSRAAQEELLPLDEDEDDLSSDDSSGGF